METLRTATTLLETFYGKDSPYSRGCYGGLGPMARQLSTANNHNGGLLSIPTDRMRIPCMRAPPHIQLRRALSSLLLPSGGSSTELGHFSDILTLHQPHTNFFSRRWDFALLKPSRSTSETHRKLGRHNTHTHTLTFTSSCTSYHGSVLSS